MSLRDGVTFAAFVVLGLLIAAKLEIGNTLRFEGAFVVVDGDTLRQGEERLRIEGIDAPEVAQVCMRDDENWSCGSDARLALREISSLKGFSCRGSGRDRYLRVLVHCQAGDVDAGSRMVETGMAIATDDSYLSEEASARRRGAGLWAGQFDMPRDWRRANEIAEKADEGQGMFSTVLEFIGWLR